MKTGKSRALLLDLMLVSNPELLCVVRAAIERLTEISGFSPEESRAVTRAVDEALANIMRHAYGNRPGQSIELSCRKLSSSIKGKRRDGLEFLFYDHGAPFDRKKLHARSLDEVRPGGLGLHLMRDSMDVMRHSRVNGRNQLRLVKFLAVKTVPQLSQGE